MRMHDTRAAYAWRACPEVKLHGRPMADRPINMAIIARLGPHGTGGTPTVQLGPMRCLRAYCAASEAPACRPRVTQPAFPGDRAFHRVGLADAERDTAQV